MQQTIHKGLNDWEIKERIQKNQVNYTLNKSTKTTKEIVAHHIFTLFNFLNFSLALCLAMVGAYKNMFFIFIIILNILIGIIQEVRARKLVDKLTILSQNPVTVVRNGNRQTILPSNIVMDDTLILTIGEQIPTDVIVIEGSAELNESLLTGESDAISKQAGDLVYSGSYVESGQIIVQVVHVAEDNYAAKIVEQAKGNKPLVSEFLASISKVSKFTSFVIIPLGILLFLESIFLQNNNLADSAVVSVAALIGMLPKGLVLLISLALSSAVIKLSKQKILVQNMYAIETIARMDLLCLDKTGTLTEGNIRLESTEVVHPEYRVQFNQLISSYLAAIPDNNTTMRAIRQVYNSTVFYESIRTMSFSSKRKWGAVELKDIGTLYLGAAEKLLENVPLFIKEEQEKGRRVIVVAIAPDTSYSEEPSALELLAYFSLSDPIRQETIETLAFLNKHHINQKIISGDNVDTVAYIAKEIGFKHPTNYVDLSICQSDEEVIESAKSYDIFGRVTPYQKKLLVQAFKEQGHIVGMTGDGVNDILALRDADVSIAMGEGDSATRQISDLVLLNSDLSTLPEVIHEGRRIVHNISQSAGVFFIKTIYSFLVTVLCILTGFSFPFIPLQITLIDLLIEGYPAFFLSFEEKQGAVQTQFLEHAFLRATPYAFLVTSNIFICMLLSLVTPLTWLDARSLMFYLLIAISSMAVLAVCIPFNKSRIVIFTSMIMGLGGGLLFFSGSLMILPLKGLLLWLFILILILNALFFTSLKKAALKLTELPFIERLFQI